MWMISKKLKVVLILCSFSLVILFLIRDDMLALGNPIIDWIYLILDNLFKPAIFVSFLVTAFGIYGGFYLDRQYSKREFRNKVYRIVPYIITELERNLHSVQSENFILYTDFFIMYKDELANWDAINVIPITEIYSYLETPSNLILEKKEVIIKLIKSQLDLYAKWYKGEGKSVPPFRARNELNSTIQRYKKYNFPDLKDILPIWENRLMAMSKKFNEKYDEIE